MYQITRRIVCTAVKVDKVDKIITKNEAKFKKRLAKSLKKEQKQVNLYTKQ